MDTWTIAVNKLYAMMGDRIPEVKKIIYHYPATIVLWEDGTKTVVKSNPHDYIIPSAYTGFCVAVAKKVFGSTTRLNKIFDEKVVYQDDGK